MTGAAAGAESSTPPKYSPEPVEQAVLTIVIYVYPTCLTMAELLLRIAGDPKDRREIDTITCAVRDLEKSGLLQKGHDERIEPTSATLRAVSLLLD
jgi:hypothetical protein